MRRALISSATLALAVVTARALTADDTPKAPPPALTSSPSATLTGGDSREVRVIILRHVRVEIASEMLKKLGYDSEFVADSRTNSVIAHNNSKNLAKLEELIKIIDRPAEMGAIPHLLLNNVPAAPPERIKRKAPLPANRAEDPFNLPFRGGAELPVNSVVVPADALTRRESQSAGEPAPESVGNWRRTFAALNAHAAQTAVELRQSQNGERQNENVVAELKRKLRDQVAAAYDARTQMQQSEVNWLRERLTHIEKQLESRGRLKDQIIEHRIDELLDPGIQWEPPDSGWPANGAAQIEPRQPSQISVDKEVKTKQKLGELSLAMRNYHDAHGHLPKAITTAREVGGKTDTPHSWRVDLLPFVGAANLYQQYRMDEPWDGPDNKKLIAQMPEVFRSSYDDPKSTNSSYFVLVGGGTPFEPGPHRIKISDITDGTSNTILIVESKRDIPWTEPRDIHFDAAKRLPKIGGFLVGKFHATMADGSVHLFERAKIEDILRWMIIRDDTYNIMIPLSD
jgi:Protein of unknown function (DUF1559)